MKAEYISREKTLKAIRTSVSEVFNVASNAGRMYQKITEIVESVPAADVVPVVRCRECKHYKERRTKKYGNLICRCTRMSKYDMDYPVKPDDFCSYGERRETNENQTRPVGDHANPCPRY